MALKIRLQRRGKKHSPVYKLVVAEGSAPRDGRSVEELGTYSPMAQGQTPEFQVNIERIEYWLGVGAQPSDTAKQIIKKARKVEANNGIAKATAAA